MTKDDTFGRLCFIVYEILHLFYLVCCQQLHLNTNLLNMLYTLSFYNHFRISSSDEKNSNSFEQIQCQKYKSSNMLFSIWTNLSLR